MEHYLISVDLGGSKVVAALGLHSTAGETIVVDTVTRPMSGLTKGEVTNIEHVTSAIREAVGELESRNGVKASEVWVSISGKHIISADNSGSVFVSGADGEITQKDVDKLHDNMNNVQAPEGKIILKSYPQHYKVDGNETVGSPVGRFGHRLDTTYNFILASKSPLERISKAFERCGLGPINYVCGAVASATVCALDEEKEIGVAVVDLGADSTDLCIIQGKVVRYAASIPMGSAAINKDISTAAIPTAKIEMLKTKCGYATASAIPQDKLNKAIRINTHLPQQKNREITYRDLTTIIDARMQDIIEYVVAEIKESGFHNRLPGGIVLTGGGSRLNGVEIIFHERTGYPVRLGLPVVDVAANSVEGYGAPELATAIGLLAIGIEESGLAVSDYEREGGEQEVVVTPTAPVSPQEPAPAVSTPTDEPEQKKSEEEEDNKGNGGKTDEGKEKPEEKAKKPKKGLFSKLRDALKRGGEVVSDAVFGGNVVDDDM